MHSDFAQPAFTEPSPEEMELVRCWPRGGNLRRTQCSLAGGLKCSMIRRPPPHGKFYTFLHQGSPQVSGVLQRKALLSCIFVLIMLCHLDSFEGNDPLWEAAASPVFQAMSPLSPGDCTASEDHSGTLSSSTSQKLLIYGVSETCNFNDCTKANTFSIN